MGRRRAALADRGLVDDAGLTEEGAELRARLEVHTDALSADPWLSSAPERTAASSRSPRSSRGRWSPTAP